MAKDLYFEDFYAAAPFTGSAGASAATTAAQIPLSLRSSESIRGPGFA